jgi:EAL domain-containing protein (putative c-di-GMP-specific phosphodiesterase class I)
MTVLDAALRQSREWERDGLVLPVAVNLSVRNLYDPEFPGEVARLLHRWEVPAERLEFEITESTVMSRPARARHVLDELGRLGIALAIDDFGTGHSSLAYLKQLPVRQIKIDKSFVMQMDAGSDDEAIVQATIGLARSLGLEVVAEGVETAEAWKVLSALGCDFAQGYYLSRPLPPDELVHWLEFSPEEPTIVRTAPIPVPPVHVHPDGPGELRASQRTRPSADLG